MSKDTATDTAAEQKLLASIIKSYRTLYAEANGEITKEVTGLLNETDPTKQPKALLHAKALVGTGYVPLATVVDIVTKRKLLAPAVKLEMANLYLSSNPSKENSVTFLEAVESQFPELIKPTLLNQKEWTVKELHAMALERRFTGEEFFFALEELLDEMTKKPVEENAQES